MDPWTMEPYNFKLHCGAWSMVFLFCKRCIFHFELGVDFDGGGFRRTSQGLNVFFFRIHPIGSIDLGKYPVHRYLEGCGYSSCRSSNGLFDAIRKIQSTDESRILSGGEALAFMKHPGSACHAMQVKIDT
jgi:hypothetical protein